MPDDKETKLKNKLELCKIIINSVVPTRYSRSHINQSPHGRPGPASNEAFTKPVCVVYGSVSHTLKKLEPLHPWTLKFRGVEKRSLKEVSL